MNIEEAWKELAGLEPDDIAKALAGLGIRGKRRQSCRCPLARYLEEATGARVHVNCFAAHWSEDRGGRWMLPPSLGDFVSAFDRGDYPELEEL